MIISVDIEEMFKKVVVQLGYIAGKRAKDAEEYHRYAACRDGDSCILQILLEQAVGWLALECGHRWLAAEKAEGRLIINLSCRKQPAGADDIGQLAALVAEAVTAYMIAGWLRLLALDFSSWEKEAAEKAAFIGNYLRFGTGLQSRRLPPI